MSKILEFKLPAERKVSNKGDKMGQLILFPLNKKMKAIARKLSELKAPHRRKLMDQ